MDDVISPWPNNGDLFVHRLTGTAKALNGDDEDEMRYFTPENSQNTNVNFKAFNAIHTSPKRFRDVRATLSRGLDKIRRRVFVSDDEDSSPHDAGAPQDAAVQDSKTTYERRNSQGEQGNDLPTGNIPKGVVQPADDDGTNLEREDGVPEQITADEDAADDENGPSNKPNTTAISNACSKGKDLVYLSVYVKYRSNILLEFDS